jgi:hypothetical protein
MVGHQPAPGERIGFMVSAGNARGQDDHLVAERSDIVEVLMPSAAVAYPPAPFAAVDHRAAARRVPAPASCRRRLCRRRRSRSCRRYAVPILKYAAVFGAGILAKVKLAPSIVRLWTAPHEGAR